ncbi:MAG: hypothetical protein ACXAE3_02185 [Candidatus Kariarchaeaceae archaeon]|jgi:hypothetical protein
MSSREKMAHSYLFFRTPTEYLIVFFPLMVGIFTNIFNTSPQSVGSVDLESIETFQFNDLRIYLFSSKITIMILVSFFICYRWANMLADGSYGFWLTTGVVRRRFFYRTIFKFVNLLAFAQFLGMIILSYLNEYFFSIITLLTLGVSVYSGLFFQVVLAVFLSNLLRNPEFASITYLTIMGFNLTFNSANSGVLYLMFLSDLAFNDPDALLAVILAFASGAILLVAAVRVHLSQDIDM